MDSLFKNIELLVKVSALLIALFTVFKFFSEQRIDQERQKKDRALSTIQSFNEVDIRSARRVLFDFWLAHPRLAYYTDSFAIQDSDYNNAILEMLTSYDKKSNVLNSIFQMAELYDYVYFCFDAQICDSSIIERFYCEKATSLYDNYLPIFEEIRDQSSDQDFGQGIQRLAAQCQKI